MHCHPRSFFAFLAATALAFAPVVSGTEDDAGAKDDAGPTVYLNHLYRVVDAATYDAIAASAFVREELAGGEERTTTAADGFTWSGLYLYGEETYLEFFGPGTLLGSPGASGLVLGVDGAGELDRVRARLAAATGVEPAVLARERLRDEEAVPWFRMTGYYDPRAVLTMGIMEYHPGYLAGWYGDAEAGADVTRRRNRRPDFRPDRLLQDVVAITVAQPAAETDRLFTHLEALGWEISAENGRRTARGPEITLAAVPANDERRGIVAVELRLRRDVAARELRLGGSRLVLRGDRTATWHFE